MKAFAWLIAVAAVSASASVFAADVQTGLAAGNAYTSTRYNGSVTVLCTGPHGASNYFYACSVDALDPAITSAFVTEPSSNGANQVALSSTWENGKVINKSTGFDAAAGKSQKEFNLWISTLFQTPLLNMGTNKIHYVLSKDGTPETQGDFVVTVKDGGSQNCGSGVISEFNEMNCQNMYEMCDRFFNEVARCSK